MEKNEQGPTEHGASLDLNRTIPKTYLEQTRIKNLRKIVSEALYQDSVHPALQDRRHVEPEQGKLGREKITWSAQRVWATPRPGLWDNPVL